MPFLPQAFVVSIRLLFLLLVILVNPANHTNVGEGTVIIREQVHGYPVTDDEIAVSVSSLIGSSSQTDEFINPWYGYPVTAGGFTAWRMADCKRQWTITVNQNSRQPSTVSFCLQLNNEHNKVGVWFSDVLPMIVRSKSAPWVGPMPLALWHAAI